MSGFEHTRHKVISKHQHPYIHPISEFSYSNSSLGTAVTNAEEALDWIFAVLYPHATDSVATKAALDALVGSSINDYRIVMADEEQGGVMTAYRYEQLEGAVAAGWNLVYRLDWGESTVVSGVLNKTMDVCVYRYGYDEKDGDGVDKTGVDAGQTIYGGATANTHLTLKANSGDGVGASTGYVQHGDNVRPQLGSTYSLGTTSERYLKVWADSATFATTTLGASGAINDSGGTLVTSGIWQINGGLTDANVPVAINIGDASNTVFGTQVIVSGSSFVGAINQLQQSQYYEENTGIVSWTGAGVYYSVSGSDFTVERGGTGYIRGKAVTWAGGQTVSSLAANTTCVIYMDATGTIGSTTTFDDYASYIFLFEVMNDGTNIVVVKEDHPYNVDAQLSHYLHHNVGVVIRGTGAIVTRVAAGTGAATGDREIEISGADVLEDHGLVTTIPDSGGTGETWDVYYTNGSGNWTRYVEQTQIPMFYNNAGTPTALATGGANSISVMVLYVSKDDKNTATPTYYAVMDNAAYPNTGAALNAISDGTVSVATNELAFLELAQLGYAVIVNNVSGGYIFDLIIQKSTFNSKLVGGGTVGNAALISVSTGSFDGILSAADSNVQQALETIDDIGLQLNVDNLRLDGNTLSSTDTNGNVIIDPNGTGLIELGSAYYPATDSAWDIGKTGNRWNDLWIDGNIQDGTTTFTIANLMTFATVGSPSTGDSLFWDGAKWAASNPDTEISHGEIADLTSADDHTQYLLLAGRSGGQTVYGSQTTAENLSLIPNSAATNGKVIFTSNFSPVGNGAEDIGGSSNYIKDLYIAGQLIGARLQNDTLANITSACSAGTIGRMFWATDTVGLYLDQGGTPKRISSDSAFYEDAVTWDGSNTTQTYDMSAYCDDARRLIWQLKDNSKDFVAAGGVIDHPTATGVRVTFAVPPAAGTFTLVGR